MRQSGINGIRAKRHTLIRHYPTSNNKKEHPMKKEAKNKRINVSRIEATVALAILSAGTLYGFYDIAKDNASVLYGAGVILVYACLRSIFRQFK